MDALTEKIKSLWLKQYHETALFAVIKLEQNVEEDVEGHSWAETER